MFGYSIQDSKRDYLCVNSTKKRYSENQYREITTANWGLVTLTNQPFSCYFLIILTKNYCHFGAHSR